MAQAVSVDNLNKGIGMAQEFYKVAAEYLVKYGFQVLGGIIILVVGFVLAQWSSNLFVNFCGKKKMDVTLTKFLAGIVKIIIIAFAGLMAVDKFGITISPLIATVSALIFGASFAIQAPLSNYAAGLMVILTRPFVVGNTISVKGVSGIVSEVKLPCTILCTEDGDKITIPNKEIVGQILYNSAEYKVVEKTVGIGYSEDPRTAIDIITRAITEFPKVAKNPAPQIGIEAFGESAVTIGMRYWVPTKEYYQMLYAVNLAVYEALRKGNITIPFPQQEVHIISK